jgi:type II secretory pathway pseudopilin PulG
MMFNYIRTRLRKQNGFTMIEALIIAALLGVMVTTFASYQYQRAKQAKARESKTELNQLQTNVKSSIGQSESLTHTEDLQFKDLSTATPSPTIDPTTPTPEPTVTPDCGGNGCTFNSTSGQCEVLASPTSCVASGNCPEGCVIIGSLVTTTSGAATNGGTTTSGGTTVGSGGGTTAATPPPATPHPTLCPMINGPTNVSQCNCPNAPLLCNQAGTDCTLTNCPGSETCQCGAGPSGGSTTSCTSTNDCENSMTQCVETSSTHSCFGGPTQFGRTDCACPGKYIYNNPICPPVGGNPAVQCYLR